MSGKTAVIVLLVIGAAVGVAEWLSTDGTPVPTPPTISIVSNSDAGTVVDVVVHGVMRDTTTVDSTTYDVISLPGEVTADLDIGKPQVPQIAVLLGVPDNAQVSVSVQALDSTMFGIGLCYPYQGMHSEDSVVPFVIDTGFYALDTFYPGEFSLVSENGLWRELTVSSTRTLPVRYNPLPRFLKVYSRYRVTASYSGGLYAHRVVQPWIANMYAGLLTNFARLNQDGWLDVEWQPCVELIVTVPRFENALASLVQWQEKRGIKTEVVVGSNWTAAVIISTILARFNNPPSGHVLQWVLLVGNSSEVPRFDYGGGIFSDYRYALVTGSDFYPEVGVGRLSPTDENDLSRQVSKILTYEKNPQAGNWPTRAAMVAHYGRWPEGTRYFKDDQRDVITNSYNFWGFQFDSLFADWGCRNIDVENYINGPGAGIVDYRGHGGRDCWDTWDSEHASWDIDNINHLQNTGRTPVVISIACLNHDMTEGTCLGEMWMSRCYYDPQGMLVPGGAVASLGATASNHSAPDREFNIALFNALGVYSDVVGPHYTYHAPVFDLGGVQNWASAFMALNGHVETIKMYCWFGDPAMEIWNGGVPLTPDVSCPTEVPLGDYMMNVRVTAGLPVLPVFHALVCARKGNQTLATGLTDDEGNVSLHLDVQEPGPVEVTVTGGHRFQLAPNPFPNPILPCERVCLARDMACVLYQSSRVDDNPPRGDGDGEIDPNEEIHLPVWVKNIGSGPAPNVVANLFNNEQNPERRHYIQFIWNEVHLGDIPAGGSVSSEPNYFSFTVSSDCPAGYSIPFWLDCHDDYGGCWGSFFNYTVTQGLPTNVEANATFPTQARHLVRRPNSEELHFVYQKLDGRQQDSVWYQKSQDGGRTWSRDALARGQNPCISLDFHGLPWVTYTRGDSLFGNACDATGQWHEFLVYTNDLATVGPPSFICSNLRDETQPEFPDIGYVVFTRNPRDPQDPVRGLLFAAFDPEYVNPDGRHSYCVSWVHSYGDLDPIDTMPCIAKTPGDYLHVVWQIGRPDPIQEDSIMYQAPVAATAPWLIRAGTYPVWVGARQVQLAHACNLNSPFVDAYGLEVFATWADDVPEPEGGHADVQRKAKLFSSQSWPIVPENWSATQDHPSDYPSMCAGALVWANDGGNQQEREIRARWNLTDPPTLVHSSGDHTQTFTHADYQVPAPFPQPYQGVLRVLFTEQTDNGYAVRMVRYNRPFESSIDGTFYSAGIGDSTPSVFCVQRDGAKRYSSCDIDYDTTELEYQLLYLNPMYRYRVRLVMYHEDPGRCRENAVADSAAPQTLTVWPREQETMWVELPTESYQDAKTNLSISKLLGREAVLTDLTVFQYEDTSPSGGGGGAQSGGIEGPRLQPALNSASLFSGHLRINYVVPSDARVSLQVLDLTGRVVRTLLDERSGLVRSGLHAVEWDGRGDIGMALPAGVYFCRLETRDVHISRKLVLTR